MTAKEKILEAGYEDVIVFENPSYDTALIGVTYRTNQAVYDYEMMVEYLVNEENMTYDEAADFVSFNNSFFYGEGYPIVLHSFLEYNNKEYTDGNNQD